LEETKEVTKITTIVKRSEGALSARNYISIVFLFQEFLRTGLFQYLKPNLSPSGLPPNMTIKVKIMRPRVRVRLGQSTWGWVVLPIISNTLPRAAQNSVSPYHSTVRRLIKLTILAV
jgi:hypothetical protein